MPPLVLPSRPCQHVRVLAINRPEKRNALSQELIDRLLEELRDASRDDSVRVIVVTGTDKLFCAGADIKEIASLDSEAANQRRYLEDLCDGVAAVKKPLIAAVEGIAFGGGFEVALMCDLIFASTSAKFGLPEVKIGLIPGAGGTQRLTNAVGKYRAMEIILFGNPISSQEAQTMGLIAELFEPGKVLQNTIKVASELAQRSSEAVCLAKKAICHADALGREDKFERELYYSAFSTRDKVEGISAFLEKRNPRWQGM
ncbi:ClpP/crotonase-like domain-containing protein [Staphylotrichum tortipilum]|uniref:ClpP/crotonase-like domain-containing protein n=1 Tax=Staphylotrichum tortipilum TaxID=2831512 RepID=A0AAN6RRB5_9PEZI|nr:ClpP/crotonase-like domain-containing protein [Staphylotrichum longicolle]